MEPQFFALSNDVKKNRESIRSTSVYSVNEERAFKRNSGAPMLEGALNRQQPGFSTTFRDKSNFQLFKDQPFVRTIGFQLCDFFLFSIIVPI